MNRRTFCARHSLFPPEPELCAAGMPVFYSRAVTFTCHAERYVHTGT